MCKLSYVQLLSILQTPMGNEGSNYAGAVSSLFTLFFLIKNFNVAFKLYCIQSILYYYYLHYFYLTLRCCLMFNSRANRFLTKHKIKNFLIYPLCFKHYDLFHFVNVRWIQNATDSFKRPNKNERAPRTKVAFSCIPKRDRWEKHSSREQSRFICAVDVALE